MRPLELATALILAAASAALLVVLTRIQPVGMDFAPLWSAASKPSIAYDARAISEILGYSSLRPFAYPPTALLILSLFALLPFPLAFGLWAIGGVGFLGWAAVKAEAPWWTMLFPPVLLAAHVGQASLLVGGLILSGLLRRDWQRGVLFGLALSIKPQLCIFLPLALSPRGLLAAAAASGALAIVATLAFGAGVWAAWLGSLGILANVVQSTLGLNRNLLQTSPYLLPIALMILWLTRNSNVRARFGALVGCALLVSPYAMNYELALLAPAIAGALVPSLALGLGFLAGTPVLLIALLALVLRTCADTENPEPNPEKASA